jgi:hypothetical protein
VNCYAHECEDCKWRIRIDAMSAATGEELSTSISFENWECMGLGEWEALTPLERQYLVRHVCTALRVIRRNGGLQVRQQAAAS